MLTTRLQLAPRLSKGGATPLLPISVFTARTGTTLTVYPLRKSGQLTPLGILIIGLSCAHSIKGKVCPRRDHKGPEGEQRYSFTLSLTSALDGSV